MRTFVCHQCGSVQSVVSRIRPRDFPSKYYFVECADCHATVGVVDIYDLMDRSRKLFDELMSFQVDE